MITFSIISDEYHHWQLPHQVNNPTTDWTTYGNLTSAPASCPAQVVKYFAISYLTVYKNKLLLRRTFLNPSLSQPEPTTLSPLLLPSSALLATTTRSKIFLQHCFKFRAQTHPSFLNPSSHHYRVQNIFIKLRGVVQDVDCLCKIFMRC